MLLPEDNSEIRSSCSRQPTISVIVPCYNDGEYVDEAVQSVLAQTYKDCEIVVVDDGSTDERTVRALEKYKEPNVSLIRTSNQGLASARNNGIKACAGRYILPLDADDKIGNTYLEKAVRVLEANENVGIVYCKAEFFGDVSGAWELPAYQFPAALRRNVIFCSAFFRKSDWTKVNGYNPNMIYGWEDYDFWLSLIELGRDVFCIPETLFFYRRRSSSMIRRMTREQVIHSYGQLLKNHTKLYAKNISGLSPDLNYIMSLEHRLDEQISELQQHILRLESVIRDLESSISWRVTRPLRFAKAVVRQFSRNVSSWLG